MKRTWIGLAALTALSLGSMEPVRADFQAYSTLDATGNQAFGGNLGVDFNVNSTITVTALGAFDSGQLPFAPGITVGLYQRLPGGDPNLDHTGALLTSLIITGSAGSVSGNYRFLSLGSPLTLLPGFYSVVAVGFNGTNLNLNENIHDGSLINTDSGGGLISFVGSGRFDGNGSLDYPFFTTDEQGFNTSAHVFGGGSFLFHAGTAVPEPSSLITLGASALCVVGYARHRRKKAT